MIKKTNKGGEFKKHSNNIAWETEVWLMEVPDHMINFNGDRFMGPRIIGIAYKEHRTCEGAAFEEGFCADYQKIITIQVQNFT